MSITIQILTMSSRKKSVKKQKEESSEDSYSSDDTFANTIDVGNANNSADGGLDAATELLKTMNLTAVEPPAAPASKSRSRKKESGNSNNHTNNVTNVTNVTDDIVDNKRYCVGFLRPADGSRSAEVHYKVFVSNNVGVDRKAWQEGSSFNLKTEKAILCDNGDADAVLAAWDKLYSKKAVKGKPGWYVVSKEAVNQFVDKVSGAKGYSSVTESKAKKVVPRLGRVVRLQT